MTKTLLLRRRGATVRTGVAAMGPVQAGLRPVGAANPGHGAGRDRLAQAHHGALIFLAVATPAAPGYALATWRERAYSAGLLRRLRRRWRKPSRWCGRC